MPHIVTEVPRLKAEVTTMLTEFDPATLVEAAGGRGMLDPAIRPAWPGARVSGAVVTVDCPYGDNLMLHKAITVAEPGDVLVVTTGGCLDRGAWGEIMTIAAQARGIAGLITDGAVRDVDAMQRLAFPAFSRGTAIVGCTKTELGRINHPVNCGGVYLRAGDVISANVDGIVAIRHEEAAAVLEAARARSDKEAAIMAELRKGATTLELLGLEGVFDEAEPAQE